MPKEKRRRGRRVADEGALSGVQAAKKRREDRREKFLAGLHGTKAALSKDKEVKKVGKVLADFRPLTQVIEEYEAEAKQAVKLLERNHKSSKQGKKKVGKLKNRQRKRIQMQELAVFKQVLNHPATQENPTAAIKEHLLNTFASPPVNE